MPKVRRQNLPPALFQHLLERIESRKIPATHLELLATWLDTEPDVPEGEWFKRFSGMTVCGEGELIKTFLLPGQAAKGKRVPCRSAGDDCQPEIVIRCIRTSVSRTLARRAGMRRDRLLLWLVRKRCMYDQPGVIARLREVQVRELQVAA